MHTQFKMSKHNLILGLIDTYRIIKTVFNKSCMDGLEGLSYLSTQDELLLICMRFTEVSQYIL